MNQAVNSFKFSHGDFISLDWNPIKPPNLQISFTDSQAMVLRDRLIACCALRPGWWVAVESKYGWTVERSVPSIHTEIACNASNADMAARIADGLNRGI